ncbi:MAG: hypothetical protein REI78_09845 [Pedobacter sp.]|nr:hypothetical protein [Pedobacter sp.]
MKKIVYVIVLLAFVGTTSQAQKLNAAKVPTAVKTAFSKTHVGILKVTWSKEDANFEAEFTLDGKKSSEVYLASGTFLESEVEIKVSELPAAVKMKLKDQKVAEAAKITKANGSIIYEAEVKGKDLFFDANGNAVKL